MEDVKNADISSDQSPVMKPQTGTVHAKTAADIRSYRDMGQVSGRVDQLYAEIRKVKKLIDQFEGVLAEKREMLHGHKGCSVQLECEIDSVEEKLKGLNNLRKAQETAALCCRMYGIFGMDYSVSAGRLYYMGEPVRHFTDSDISVHGMDGFEAAYSDQQGRVSVEAVHGSTGHVLYLKVYDY